MYIWGCIVSRLINIHQNGGFGSPYEPSSGINEGMLRSTIISILSFVDDCNLYNAGIKFEIVHDIMRKTTSDAQLRNDLI